MTRFKKYYGEVFYEMAKFCEANGIYVVMRPPGVSPWLEFTPCLFVSKYY